MGNYKIKIYVNKIRRELQCKKTICLIFFTVCLIFTLSLTASGFLSGSIGQVL